MKYMMLFFVFLSLAACKYTRKIEVIQMGQPVKIEVEQKDILSSTELVVENFPSEEKTETRSCTHMSTCCKCGFTFDLKHECSCGIWRNCPGKKEVDLKIDNYSYKIAYQIKQKTGEVSTYESPIYRGSKETVKKESTCN